MIELSEQSSSRIDTTAERLRRIQIDFIDQSVALRRDYLLEELRRALLAIDPAEHATFLHVLRGQFLGTGGEGSGSDATANGQVLDAVDTVALSGEVPQSAVAGDLLAPAISQLSQTLALPPGQSIDLPRVVAMAAVLAEFALAVSKLSWTAWRTIAPRAAARRTGNPQKLFARFATGDEAVTPEHVDAELDRLRQLIAAMISAISQVGSQFASAHLDKFSPTEINAAVDAEGGVGMFKTRAGQCWRKYVELAEGLDHSAIESEIKRVIADHAEQLMRGVGRSTLEEKVPPTREKSG